MDGSKNRQRVLAKKAVKICREVFAFCTNSEISSSCERNTYDPRIFSSIRPRTGRDKSATPYEPGHTNRQLCGAPAFSARLEFTSRCSCAAAREYFEPHVSCPARAASCAACCTLHRYGIFSVLMFLFFSPEHLRFQ